MRPGADALMDLAARTLPTHASVLHLGGPSIPPARLASRRLTALPFDEALPYLEAHAADPYDAILAAFPSRDAPLIPLLRAMHGALRAGGVALVCDLVWQTAPTPELVRAFAPAPGREKVRPVEGYEMQAEHAGFEIAERATLDPALAAQTAQQRGALHADARGAARVVAWTLRRA